MKHHFAHALTGGCGRRIFRLALGLVCAGFALAVSAAPPAGYYLVWNDEFDGSSLNGSKWVTYTGTHRDAVNTASALSIGSSDLTITTYTSGGTHYTGFIGTQGKFYAKYGYFEAYIDWNDSPGMWSAFWLQSDMMDDWPFPTKYVDNTLAAGAEIDVVEHRSQTSSGANISNQGVSNLHWNGYDTYATSTGSSLYGSGLNSGYHTYGLLWDSSNYRFYVDGSQVYSTGTANSEHSEWIVLSSEVQNGAWAGSIPGGGYGSSGSSSTKMKVAYVRYYAPNSMVFWDGSSSAYWTNTANWVAGKSVPANGDVVFSLLSTGNYTTKLGADYTVNSLSILESSYITIKENALTINNLVDMNSAWNNAQIDSDVVLGNANTWRIGAGRLLSVNGNVSGGHSLTLDGYGTVALNGDNSYTLGTTVNKGTLRISSDNALGATGTGTTVANGAQLQIYGVITSGEPLTLDGTTPALRASAGANATLTGPITLANAVTVKLDGGTALAVNGNIGGSHSLYLAGDGGSLGTINGSINTGSFAVTKSGSGTWVLAGNNTFTGDLNVDSGSTSANDGTLCLASSGAAAGAASIQIRNNSGANAASTLALDGTAGDIAVAQPIYLSGRNNSVPAIENLAGSNTLSGNLTINVGGSDYRAQSDAGTLVFGGNLSSAASGTRTFTFQGNGDHAVSGVIANGSAATFNIVKSGSGRLTLSTADSYNGVTEIDGGSLVLGAGGSIANSSVVTVGEGALFDASQAGGYSLGAGRLLGGGGSVAGNVIATSGATINPGSSPGVLTFSNNLTLGGGVTNAFELANDLTVGGGVNDLIVVGGNLYLSGTNTLLFTPVSGSLTNGRYTLIQYGGTLTGGATNLAVAFVGYPPAGTLTVDDSVPGEIGLIVYANPASLVWQGDGGANNWDAGGSSNWLAGVDLSLFAPGDNVTFNDASPNRVVNLAAPVAPGSLTVTGTGNYTFSGNGRLSGASGLVKNGVGTITLLTTNDYSGPTTISAGTLQLGNGTITGTLGPAHVADNGVLAFNHPGALSVSNVISGTGSFIKDGAGTLALSGNNTFSGGSTLSGGTVNLNHANGLGKGPLTLNNAVKRLIVAADLTVTNPITLNPGAGAGTLGQGLLTGPASGSATFTAPINITALVASGGDFDGGNTSGGLILNGSVTSSVPVIQRAGRVTYAGGGDYAFLQDFSTVVLGAENGLATNAVLELGTSGSTGTFDLAGFNQTLNGLQKNGTGTVGNSSTTDDSMLTISGVSSNTTFAGTIQNSVSGGSRKVHLTVAGGTFTLSGANTFSGETRAAGGTLVLANSSALQNSLVNLDGNDLGALSFGSLTAATFGGLQGTRGLALTNASGAAVALTVGNNFTGTNVCSVSLSGSGSLNKKGSGTFVLKGDNNFTGVLNVDTAQPSSGNDGVVRIASPDALSAAAQIKIQNQNSATSIFQLDGSDGDINLAQPVLLNGRNNATPGIEHLAGNNMLSGNLSLGSGGSVYALQSDSGTLTLGGVMGIHALTSGRTLTFQGDGDFLVSGVITNGSSNANSIVKAGAGTLALSGTNTYTGTTTVNAGALVINGVVGTNTLTVVTGTLGGGGVIRGPVSILADATLAPGNSVGILTVSNSVSLAGFTVMELNRAGSPNSDRLATASVAYGGTLIVTNIGGTLQVNDTFDLFDWSGSRSGAFGNVILPAGYVWDTSNLAVNGTIKVTAVPNPTLAYTLANGTLSFSWVGDYKLQCQTNTLGTGLGNTWFDCDGGDASPVAVGVDAAQETVFFRLAPKP